MFIAGIILEYNEHNPVGIEVLHLLYDEKMKGFVLGYGLLA